MRTTAGSRKKWALEKSFKCCMVDLSHPMSLSDISYTEHRRSNGVVMDDRPQTVGPDGLNNEDTCFIFKQPMEESTCKPVPYTGPGGSERGEIADDMHPKGDGRRQPGRLS